MSDRAPPNSEPYCRSAALTGFAELSRTVGLDPVRLLQSVGCPPRALTDLDLKIPSRIVARVLETAAQRSGVVDFGLRLAEQRRLSNMGAVGLVVRDQPNLRRVLEVIAQYIWIQTEAVSVALEALAGQAVVRVVLAGAEGQPSRQSTELCVGVLCRTLAAIAGPRWRPELVCFTHGPPDGPTCHRRVLGVAASFDQEFDGVVFPKAVLDADIPSADPVMAGQAVRIVDQLQRERPQRTSDRIRELVALLLPTGQATVERVATHLGVDRRTIARRLAAEGTAFSAILDGVRMDLARAYVGASRRSLTAIAGGLGFSELSAFSRWHRQRFGQSPQAYRSQSAAGRRQS